MRPRALALPAVLVLTWLLFSIPGGLTGLDLLAGVAAAGAGLLAAALWPAVHERAGRLVVVVEDLLGEGGPAPAGTGPGQQGPEGDADALDEEVPASALETVLDRLAHGLGATRLLVWRLDRESDQVEPEHAWSPPPAGIPKPLAAAGSPLAWALREGSTLRLEPAPRWTRGLAAVTPIDGDRVLTVETPLDRPVDEGRLRDAGAMLAPFLQLHDQQAHAAAASRRVERAVEFLRSVPRAERPADMPGALARAALEITGGLGALVADWTGEAGTVLATAGSGGGPTRGDAFGTLEGDLAHAARSGAAVPRDPAGPRWPPLATDQDRWDRPPPPYRVVIPLVDPREETTGLLAVWGRAPLAAQGVALLEAIGPLLALQLRQAGDLEQFREQATVDPLTRLPNRAALQDRMAEEVARFHRYRRPLSLLVVDLDHFKRINDGYGHDAGDAVLRRMGEVLRAQIRDVDVAARFGGEELVVLLPETMIGPALDVAERIRAAVEAAAVSFDGVAIPVTASIGVSSCPECVEEPEALFSSADQALYASKEGGRNRVTAASGRVVAD